MSKEELLKNLEKIHTTELGVKRIEKNLNIHPKDLIKYCVEKIKKEKSIICRKGKNYYVESDSICFTINSKSFTIITAHTI